MTRLLLPLFLGAALVVPAFACTGTATFSATATSPPPPPELVEIRPGVWVVLDYGEPVFWHDGYYWRYYDGIWYRSPRFGYDWYRVSHRAVPGVVLRIDRPRRYIHYHATGDARVRRGAPVRDHRTDRAPPRRRDNERVPARRGGDRDRSHPRTRDHR